jgi:predicted metal-binding membrane protein
MPDAMSMHDTRTGDATVRRDRRIIVTCVMVIGGLASAYLVVLHRRMALSTTTAAEMSAMGMMVGARWHASDLLFTFGMWSVMMVGMMAPAATPVLLVVAASHARRGGPRAPLIVPLFALGYLTIWLAFSACAPLAQWLLHDTAMLSPTMAAASPRLAGGLLVAAGVYQLTPAKHVCLTQCQTPMGFLMQHWREGVSGAFHMGLRHGASCLGCCWALMGVLFAVGVMNLTWVAALAAFILLERVGPYGARVARVGGVLMLVVGVLRGLGV